MKYRKKLFMILAVLFVTALVLSACVDDENADLKLQKKQGVISSEDHPEEDRVG